MQALNHEQLSFIQMPNQTNHAETRMNQRGFNSGQIASVIKYGRAVRAKGVIFMFVGRKEVSRYAKEGIDLRDVEGLQILISPDNALITVYRNHDLSRIKKTAKKRW